MWLWWLLGWTKARKGLYCTHDLQFYAHLFKIHNHNSEGHDRTDIGLPGKQDQLLQAIKGAIAKTTPMIVVLMSGGPVDITTAKVQSVCSLQTMLTDRY